MLSSCSVNILLNLSMHTDASPRSVTQVDDVLAGRRVIVVSHGAVVSALHRFITGSGPPNRVVNTSINLISLSGVDNWKVLSWGDVKHLEGLGFERDAFGGGSDSG